MSEKYQVKKCQCVSHCRTWTTVDPSGYTAYWASWERAMLRATKEW